MYRRRWNTSKLLYIRPSLPIFLRQLQKYLPKFSSLPCCDKTKTLPPSLSLSNTHTHSRLTTGGTNATAGRIKEAPHLCGPSPVRPLPLNDREAHRSLGWANLLFGPPLSAVGV